MIDLCVSWTNGNLPGTADYFNACAPSGGFSVPDNFFTYLPAASGNAYMGGVGYSYSSPNNREFFKTRLSEPLIENMEYRLELKCAFNRPVTNTNIIGMSLTRQAPVLSSSATDPDSTFLLPVSPVFNPPVTANAAEWVSIGGTYRAGGGESYLLIGNFWHSSQVVNLSPPSSLFFLVYMFVDDVLIEMLYEEHTLCRGANLMLHGDPANSSYAWVNAANSTRILSTSDSFSVSVPGTYYLLGDVHSQAFVIHGNPLPSVDLGNDTVLCGNGTLTLQVVPYPGAQYVWQNGHTGPTFTVSQAGTYHVTASLNNCISSDTLEVASGILPAVNLGPDYVLCPAETLSLDATFSAPGVRYEWQDGGSSAVYSVSGAGDYSVRVSVGSCSASDSITVSVSPIAQVNLGNDTAVCAYGPFVLDAGIPGAAYQWNAGAQTPTFTVNSSGTYAVRVSLGNCVINDSISVQVWPLPFVYLGKDTLPCPGESILLDAGTADAYQWQDASTLSTYTVTAPGTYWVRVRNAYGCYFTDSIRVAYLRVPEVRFPADTVLCDDTYLLLEMQAEEAGYLWSDKSDDSHFTVKMPGLYWGTARNRCGISSDSIRVGFRNCECVFYIPAAFTPDADGLNEKFSAIPGSVCELSEFRLGIYDRWGNLLYQTSDPKQPWDGRVKGSDAPPGIYAYQLSYRFTGDVQRMNNGSVLMLR